MTSSRATQLLEAGLWLRMSGDLDGARRLFEQVLKLDPGNARARELVGQGPISEVPLPEELKHVPRAQANLFVAPLPRLFPDPPPAAAPAPVAPPEGPPVPFPPAGWASPARVSPLRVSPVAGSDGWGEPRDAWETGQAPPTTVPHPEPAEKDALSILSSEPASRPTPSPRPAVLPPDPRREARNLVARALDLQELDNHTDARELLLQARELDPELTEAAVALAESERNLQTIYESKLGKLSVVPRVRLKEDEVIWLNLDHRAGFILAQIDGTLSFDDLFSVSGMSRLDTARILAELLDQRVILR